jgi:hypothetical protein
MEEALRIDFGERPEGLEDILKDLPAFVNVSNSLWLWESGCGSIRLSFLENPPLDYPYSLEFDASNRSGIIQKRIFGVIDTIKYYYKSCEVVLYRDFFA